MEQEEQDRPINWSDFMSYFTGLQAHYAAEEMTDDIQAIRAIAAMTPHQLTQLVGRPPDFTRVVYTVEGAYDGAWDCPVRLAEAEVILERFREIGRGEKPGDEQLQWGFVVACAIVRVKGMQLANSTTPAATGVAPPTFEEGEIKWGSLGEVLLWVAGVTGDIERIRGGLDSIIAYVQQVIWDIVLDVERAAEEEGAPPEPPAAPPEPLTEPTVEVLPPPPPDEPDDELRRRAGAQVASDDAARERIDQRTQGSLAAATLGEEPGTDAAGHPPAPPSTDHPAEPPAPPEPPPAPAAEAPPPPPPTGAPGDISLEDALSGKPGEGKPEPEIIELKTDRTGPGGPCRIVLKIEIPPGAHLEISVTHHT